jgi:chondroitin 4-sulfotransferase 11
MIVNDKYKFLFIHIQKTAGTSVTDMLNSIKYTQKEKSDHSFIADFSGDLSKYFKFCFVRNPWERLVSWYSMINERGPINDFHNYVLSNSNNFSDFLNLTDIIYEKNNVETSKNYSYPKSLAFNQLDYISDGKEILVDFVGRFEKISEDITYVKNVIGIDYQFQHLNKTNHTKYREYYNDNDAEKVYNLYERDIKYFGYEF